MEAQTGCPAARPDSDPPPITVKWFKLIQDPESSAVFFLPLVLRHLEGFRKRRRGHNDFLLVCLKHRQTTRRARLSP